MNSHTGKANGRLDVAWMDDIEVDDAFLAAIHAKVHGETTPVDFAERSGGA